MSRRRTNFTRGTKGAFSLIELIVVVTIGLVLLSIFLPYVRRVRETSNRTACANNLQQLGVALRNYARDNKGFFPRTAYDQINRPTGWHAFDPRPGALNDVTAAPWLLVTTAGVKPRLFICPSTSDTPQTETNVANFTSPTHLSYSYANPYSNAVEYGLTEYLKPDFVLLADLNPGRAGGSDVTGVGTDASPIDFARANSHNHARAGQNVLFAAGYVKFVTTPYCGEEGDNIYTALTDYPVFTGQKPPHHVPGWFGTQYSPAWVTDSYLVPSADSRTP